MRIEFQATPDADEGTAPATEQADPDLLPSLEDRAIELMKRAVALIADGEALLADLPSDDFEADRSLGGFSRESTLLYLTRRYPAFCWFGKWVVDSRAADTVKLFPMLIAHYEAWKRDAAAQKKQHWLPGLLGNAAFFCIKLKGPYSKVTTRHLATLLLLTGERPLTESALSTGVRTKGGVTVNDVREAARARVRLSLARMGNDALSRLDADRNQPNVLAALETDRNKLQEKDVPDDHDR